MKNIGKLGLTGDALETLAARVAQHGRYGNIEFEVLAADDASVTLRVTQGKSHAGVYYENQRLSEIGKELLAGLDGRTVHTRPLPYVPSPPEVVTAAWVDAQIQARGLRLKDMAHALGVDANTLSAYRHGKKPLSGVVRAMFYYYFVTHAVEPRASGLGV